MTLELTSTLPTVDQSQQRMQIVTIGLDTFEHKDVSTRMHYVDHSTGPNAEVSIGPVCVYKLDPSVTHGYMPSKVLNDGNGRRNWSFVYYMCEGLPPQARPFGDKPAYAFFLFPPQHHAIDYDAGMRIFVDQVITPGATYDVMGVIKTDKAKIAHVFIVSEDQARQMFTTTWDGDPWPLDPDVADIYK